MAALRKFKIFETWKNQGIKYVNIVDTDNVTIRICDPLALAYLMQSDTECIADVILNQSDLLEYPSVLRTNSGAYDQFFPFEVQWLSSKSKSALGRYSVPYLNMFCRVDLVKQLCFQNH